MATKTKAKGGFPMTATTYARGLDLTSNPETLPLEALTWSENTRYTRQGESRVRPGFISQVSLGTGLTSNAGGTMPFYNAMFAKSGTKIFQSTDKWVTPYDIGVSLTSSAVGVFHPLGKDMHYSNKTDGFTRIACSTLSADADTVGHILTIRTGDIGQFAASGTVYIRGIAITYSGISNSTLTGTSGETIAMKSGDLVTQTTSVSLPAAVAAGECLTDFHGILWMAGSSGTPQQLNNSGVPSVGHPEYAYDWAANGAYQSFMPYGVTCLVSSTTVMLVGTNNGLYYCTGLNQDSAVPDVEIISPLYTIPNQRSIAAIDNNTFVVFTGNRVLIVTRDYYGVHIVDNAEQPSGNFDYGIRDYLLKNADSDQTNSWSYFDATTRHIYVNVIINGIGRIFVNNYDLQAWSFDTGKQFSWMIPFQGINYAGDATTDSIYADEQSTDDNSLPTYMRMVTPIYVLDEKRISSDYTMYEFNGYISQGGAFTFRIYVNGGKAYERTITFDDLANNLLLLPATGAPIGNGEIGAFLVGRGGSLTAVYNFLCPIEIFLTGERFQAEWEVSTDGTMLGIKDSRLDGETVGVLYAQPF